MNARNGRNRQKSGEGKSLREAAASRCRVIEVIVNFQVSKPRRTEETKNLSPKLIRYSPTLSAVFLWIGRFYEGTELCRSYVDSRNVPAASVDARTVPKTWMAHSEIAIFTDSSSRSDGRCNKQSRQSRDESESEPKKKKRKGNKRKKRSNIGTNDGSSINAEMRNARL